MTNLSCGRDFSDARGLGFALVLGISGMVWLAIGVGIGLYLGKVFA